MTDSKLHFSEIHTKTVPEPSSVCECGKRYNRYELDQKDFDNIADRYGVEVDDE